MKNLLIYGTDIHSIRFIESLVFNQNIRLYICDKIRYNNKVKVLSSKYGISYIENLSENLSNIDLLYISKPLSLSFSLIKALKKSGFQGKIIIEKIIDKEVLNASKKIILLSDYEVFVFHSRLFTNENYKSIFNEVKNIIEWPNLDNKIMHPIYHTLPNILDLIYKEIKYNKIKFGEVNKVLGRFSIDILLDNCDFKINIFKTKKLENIKINNKELKWPNYFDSINKFVNKIINNQISAVKTQRYSIKQLNEINQILKKLGDYK